VAGLADQLAEAVETWRRPTITGDSPVRVRTMRRTVPSAVSEPGGERDRAATPWHRERPPATQPPDGPHRLGPAPPVGRRPEVGRVLAGHLLGEAVIEHATILRL
jgi:hypothetical protein